MRSYYIAPLFAATLMLSNVGFAADPPTTTVKEKSVQSDTEMKKETETKVKTPDDTTKTKEMVVIGTVKDYTMGKKIKISTVKDKTESFDLNSKDVTCNVDPAVTVGSKVKVTETKANGHKTVTISPYEGSVDKSMTP